MLPIIHRNFLWAFTHISNSRDLITVLFLHRPLNGNSSNIHTDSAKALLQSKVVEIQIQKEKKLLENIGRSLSPNFLLVLLIWFFWGNTLTVTCWYSGMMRFWMYTDQTHHSFFSPTLFSQLWYHELLVFDTWSLHTLTSWFSRIWWTQRKSKHLKTAKQK